MKLNKYIIRNWIAALVIMAYFLTGNIVAFAGILNQDLFLCSIGALFYLVCYLVTVLDARQSPMLRKLAA